MLYSTARESQAPGCRSANPRGTEFNMIPGARRHFWIPRVSRLENQTGGAHLRAKHAGLAKPEKLN